MLKPDIRTDVVAAVSKVDPKKAGSVFWSFPPNHASMGDHVQVHCSLLKAPISAL
jgi:hypothetical protein